MYKAFSVFLNNRPPIDVRATPAFPGLTLPLFSPFPRWPVGRPPLLVIAQISLLPLSRYRNLGLSSSTERTVQCPRCGRTRAIYPSFLKRNSVRIVPRSSRAPLISIVTCAPVSTHISRSLDTSIEPHWDELQQTPETGPIGAM